ncbi:MAG: Gfo/Idh/MocA family oxidoreductase [Acidobacteria bacterium]|nr:Gfo/Idh/MocA family oxidoreductase [Acidobacteriota bacterium]
MSKIVNWLVIGVGDITRKRVLPAIAAHERSRLRGIVTRSPDKAAPYGCPAYATLAEALRDSEINAVYVGTPVALHAPQTVTALQAGRAVLCEKPMAMNYPEARDMVAAARDAGQLFGVAYYRRLYPNLQRAKALVAAGAIGQPVLCQATCHSWVPPGIEADYWRFDPELAGGGPLYDIASHRIDAMNFLFGNPQKAAGFLSNAVHGYAVEDNATVLVEYPRGVRGVVDVRWHSQVDRDEFRIVGTKGAIEMTPLNSGRLVWPGGIEELPPHANLHYPLVAHFADALLDGSPLISSGETALWTDWVTGKVAVRL